MSIISNEDPEAAYNNNRSMNIQEYAGRGVKLKKKETSNSVSQKSPSTSDSEILPTPTKAPISGNSGHVPTPQVLLRKELTGDSKHVSTPMKALLAGDSTRVSTPIMALPRTTKETSNNVLEYHMHIDEKSWNGDDDEADDDSEHYGHTDEQSWNGEAKAGDENLNLYQPLDTCNDYDTDYEERFEVDDMGAITHAKKVHFHDEQAPFEDGTSTKDLYERWPRLVSASFPEKIVNKVEFVKKPNETATIRKRGGQDSRSRRHKASKKADSQIEDLSKCFFELNANGGVKRRLMVETTPEGHDATTITSCSEQSEDSDNEQPQLARRRRRENGSKKRSRWTKDILPVPTPSKTRPRDENESAEEYHLERAERRAERKAMKKKQSLADIKAVEKRNENSRRNYC